MTGGTGTDAFTAGVSSSKSVFVTITDIEDGETVTLAAALGNAFTTSKLSLAAGSTFADYLDAACDTADNARWFQFEGNTYVVGSSAADLTFSNGVDTVVKLVGLLDLSGSSITNDVLTVNIA